MNKQFLIASLLALSLASGHSRAESDLSAPDAFAAAGEGKLRLIDIRTPQEWCQTGIAAGPGWLKRNLPVESCAQC